MEVRSTAPRLTADEARAVARERFGVEAVVVEPLPGERDQNFLLSGPQFGRLVLKIAPSGEGRAALELQNEALRLLAEREPGLGLPRVVGDDGHRARLLTWVPGRLLVEARPRGRSLLRSLGGLLGRLDRALLSFSHPAAGRALKWDLARASWIHDYLPLLEDLERRRLVERALAEVEGPLAGALAGLRRSVIANDANDYNVLVAEDGDPLERRVCGLIDFGDMLETWTVAELAIAGAYAAMGTADPVGAIAEVAGGYHAELPLSDEELEVLLPLVRLRLAVSVTNSAHQRIVERDNAYLTVSEAPAWQLLERLAPVPPRLALYRFREACGLPPCPASPAIVRWLRENGPFGAVLSPDPREVRRVVFDLSVGSEELGLPDEWEAEPALTALLFGRMRREDARLGVGRYDEARALYTSDVFRGDGDDGEERRTVHLGMDLFAEAGTPVLAPLAGVVRSVRDNAGLLDYGPTVILEHAVPGGPTFYTLYGHLARESVTHLAPGAHVARGDAVGRIGVAAENGGWAPHVHFQIVTDLLGYDGDFPGVASPRQRATWVSLAPDPNLVVGLPPAELAPAHQATAEVRARRRERLGASLSVAYREPLHIVRGSGARLYDVDGRSYLDAVNNVAHVGHCHPRVVRAGQRQMAVLNTNTRYLHETVVRYAERLRSKLPPPLSVLFFVSSGSEANELALRLARAHTRRHEVAVLEGAYHGNTSTLIDVSPYKHDGPGGAGAPAWVRVLPLREPAQAFAMMGGLAALICEPIPSCAGQVVLPDCYLDEAFRLARVAGGVAIADEVQTGFGRVGSHFWAFETQGVVPDVVTMGKPIGNGHPLGAVATTPEIAGSFANGMEYFSTFGGNPVSCAIGMAVLDVIEEEGLQENARTVGQQLVVGLRALQSRHPIVADVRGLGLFLGVELARDGQPAGAEASYVANRMKDKGVLVGTDGPHHNVLKIKPPLVFSERDAEVLVSALESVLAEDFVASR